MTGASATGDLRATAGAARSTRRRPRNASWIGRVLPLVPAMALMACFVLGPIVWSISVSLTDGTLTGRAASDPHWIGLDNFARLATDVEAHEAIGRSLVYVVLVVAGQNVLGLALALLMRRGSPLIRAVTNGVVVAAWVMPEIVVAILWYAFLEPGGGTMNTIAGAIGLDGQQWLTSAPMAAIVIASIWRGTAFSLLVYSAGVQEVPPDTIEASQIDGANAWQRLVSVVLPSIRRIVLTTLLLTTLQTLGVFGLVYAMTAGGPNDQTETLPLFMFREAFSYNLLGYGSAVALVLVALGAILSVVYLAAFRVTEREA